MPESPDRRTFFKRSAVAASAFAVGCSTSDRDDEANQASGLSTDVLRAVAEDVLPSELGPDGKARIAAEFQTWLAEYEPVVEQLHGYGSQEIRYGPPDPTARWAAQLEALELEANARYQSEHATLDSVTRRALIEQALEAEESTALGDRTRALRAGHVVVGLLGFFYGSSEATNLCYQRRIDGNMCRPLEGSSEAPPRIEGRLAGPPPIATRPPPSEHAFPAPIEPGLEPGS